MFERKRAKHSIVCVWFFSLHYSNSSHFNVALYFSLYSNHLFKEAIRVISHDLNYFHHLFRGIFNLLLCVSFFVVIDVVVRNDDDHHSNRNRFTSIYSWRSRNNGYDRKKNDAVFIPPNVQPINSCTIKTTSRTQHQRFIERLVTSASSSISSLVHAYE